MTGVLPFNDGFNIFRSKLIVNRFGEIASREVCAGDCFVVGCRVTLRNRNKKGLKFFF